MNWTRTILDGFAMAAYFNLFAAAVALYNPRLMFPSYPPAIIRDAPEPPTKAENRFSLSKKSPKGGFFGKIERR